MQPMPLIELANIAYRKAGVLTAAGRGISGSEQMEFLHLLNVHLNLLRTQRLFVYQVLRVPFPVIQNQQDYVVGSASLLAQYGIVPDWDYPMPNRVYGAGFLVPVSGTVPPSEVPMYLITDYTEWKNVITKQTTASQARVIYYRPGLQNTSMQAPIAGTASLWPLPYQSSTLVLYLAGLVDGFSDINEPVIWPDGYYAFLENEMAVVVNANYPKAVMKPKIAQLAQQAKAWVMANQLTPLFARSDPAAQGKPNAIESGFWDARSWPGGWA